MKMNKNILILSGTPRKGGNSDLLCDQFAAGAKEAEHHVVKIAVRENKIGFCIACYACRGKGVCFQKDDMVEILEQMVNADVIVLSSPVYFYSMDGQMKTLIDRTLPRYREIGDKEFYFIATAGEAGIDVLERTFMGFEAFLDCLPKPRLRGKLCGDGVYLPGDVKKVKVFDQAYQMGKTV